MCSRRVPFTFRGWVYPLESYSRAIEGAGFVIEALREPAMPEALAEQRPGSVPASMAAAAELRHVPRFEASQPATLIPIQIGVRST